MSLGEGVLKHPKNLSPLVWSISKVFRQTRQCRCVAYETENCFTHGALNQSSWINRHVIHTQSINCITSCTSGVKTMADAERSIVSLWRSSLVVVVRSMPVRSNTRSYTLRVPVQTAPHLWTPRTTSEVGGTQGEAGRKRKALGESESWKFHSIVVEN